MSAAAGAASSVIARGGRAAAAAARIVTDVIRINVTFNTIATVTAAIRLRSIARLARAAAAAAVELRRLAAVLPLAVRLMTDALASAPGGLGIR